MVKYPFCKRINKFITREEMGRQRRGWEGRENKKEKYQLASHKIREKGVLWSSILDICVPAYDIKCISNCALY